MLNLVIDRFALKFVLLFVARDGHTRYYHILVPEYALDFPLESSGRLCLIQIGRHVTFIII